jgi:hypothetical protein
MMAKTDDMTTSGQRPNTLLTARGPRRRCTLAPRPTRGPALHRPPRQQTRATEVGDRLAALTAELEDPAEVEATPPPPADAHRTMTEDPTATTTGEGRGEEARATTMTTATTTILEDPVADMLIIRLRLA